MQIQKILNNYSKSRGFTHTCISGREEEKTDVVSLQRYFILRQTPQGRRYFELRGEFPGAILSTKNHQRGVNDNTDEADGKMFVNSFPEFKNGKDFEIKLSLSLIHFFFYGLHVSETAQCMTRSLCSFVLIDE